MDSVPINIFVVFLPSIFCSKGVGGDFIVSSGSGEVPRLVDSPAVGVSGVQ